MQPNRTSPRRPVGIGVGLAVLATVSAGCVGTPQHHAGGGPTGHVTAAPPQLSPPGSPVPTTSRRTGRPNIVEIVTDDMRTDDLRWMPNVRRLVEDQGLQFCNSFASYPLCAPARSSLLSGQYAHNTGVWSVRSGQSFNRFDDRATIGTAMNHAGYNTVFLGKYLNGYGTETSKVTGRNSFRYVPAGWTEWWGSVERPPNSGYPSGGTYDYFHGLFNHDGHIDDSFKGRYQTVVEGRLLRRMVKKYHRSRKPFFMYFAPIAPHFGGPHEKGDPEGVVWPGTGKPERFKTPARPGRVRGMFDKRITRPSGLPLGGGESQRDVSRLPRPMRWLPRIDPSERRAMLSLTRQRAEALFVLDRQVKKLVATLKRTGEYRNTVLMFTSDNGYFLGEHRMRQGKIWAHEPSLRVPFLVAGPGIPHGVRYDPVSTEDIPATILQLGHARPPHPPEGVSLVPSFRRDRGWRVPVVVEGLEGARVMRTASERGRPGFPTPLTGTGIRTAQWKYVRYVDGDGELYDLDRDPNELHNLYGRKRYAAVQARLARLWAAYRSCSGAQCRKPLPDDLQTGPHQLARATRAQQHLVEARYGVPAL
jgi:N-acetylglucosamine-6-sulfatase